MGCSRGTKLPYSVDAEVDAEADVEYEAVEVGRVLAKMKTANNGMNLVILDACETTFARSFRSAQKVWLHKCTIRDLYCLCNFTWECGLRWKGDNGLYTGELINI